MDENYGKNLIKGDVFGDRMGYEMVLRFVARLINNGDDPGRGALMGYADADWWDSFEKRVFELERSTKIEGLAEYGIVRMIQSLLSAIDVLRLKIEQLDLRIKDLEK